MRELAKRFQSVIDFSTKKNIKDHSWFEKTRVTPLKQNLIWLKFYESNLVNL